MKRWCNVNNRIEKPFLFIWIWMDEGFLNRELWYICYGFIVRAMPLNSASLTNLFSQFASHDTVDLLAIAGWRTQRPIGWIFRIRIFDVDESIGRNPFFPIENKRFHRKKTKKLNAENYCWRETLAEDLHWKRCHSL